MSRIETIADGVTLYLGDCGDVLPTLRKVDAVVTDPPYGIGYVKGAGGNGRHNRRNIAPIVGDDNPFDPSALLPFGNVLMWGADHYYPRLPDSGRWLAWNKLGDLEPWDSFADVEFAWHSRDGAARMFSLAWKGVIRAEENGAARHHPSQKPLALMAWCIEQCGDAGIILDPYMGSGSTGVAAARLGRQFIGIEIDPKYFDIACKRVADALKQTDMFIEKPKPATQDTFATMWDRPFYPAAE